MRDSILRFFATIMLSLAVVPAISAESVSAAGYYGIVIDGGFDGQRPLDQSTLGVVLDILATEKDKKLEASPPTSERLNPPSPRPTSSIMVYNAAPVKGGKYSPEDKMTAQVLYFSEAGLVTWSDRRGDSKAGGTREQGVVNKVKEICSKSQESP